jgi:hypothetical protein
MLKFRCQHCGQRIAVPARHLGKLVRCAECGEPTHPLAEQIVKAKKEAAPVAAPASSSPSEAVPCGNCGRSIGRLQQAHLWQEQRVCGPCHQVLATESSGGRGRLTAAVVERVARDESAPPVPGPIPGLRDRVLRSLVVFVVAVVALYGALTLLRDIAGLIATMAVGILALVALYAIFRSRWMGRARPVAEPSDAALVAVRR